MAAADLVLHNGHLITMDKARPTATAIAISNGRISAIGDDCRPWISSKTLLIDLKGAYVYPGFIDSHAHIIPLGATKDHLNLTGLCKEAILKQIAKSAKEGEWLFGYGWNEELWSEKKLPSAQDLDAACPHHPVFLRRIDTHAAWVNTRALQIAGITEDTPDPQGGKVFKDAENRPTGILLDTAMDLVMQHFPEHTREDSLRFCHTAFEEILRKGITMVHNASTRQSDLEAFKALAEKKELPIRIYAMVLNPILGPILGPKEFLSPQSYGPFLEARCIKLYVDGALGSRGASLLEPYSDDPSTSGMLLWDEDELLHTLQRIKAQGNQVCVHAIGDRANRLLLDSFEKIGVKGLRWRIEHAQLLHESDINRFASLDVIASMQPLHVLYDMAWVVDRVGPERAKKGAYVWKSLLNSGATLIGGSDAPVVDINPLWGIYAAITRQDFQGNPAGGWFAEQRLGREDALGLYTTQAAYAAFKEEEVGSLREGELADLVVLPENLLTCDPKALIEMQVLYTIVNGKIQYEQFKF